MASREPKRIAYDAAVGRVLAVLRHKWGMSQHQLAQRIGATQSTLSRAEKGTSQLEAFQQLQFAELCGLDVVQLTEAYAEVFKRAGRLLVQLLPGCYEATVWSKALELGSEEDLQSLFHYVAHGVLGEARRRNDEQ